MVPRYRLNEEKRRNEALTAQLAEIGTHVSSLTDGYKSSLTKLQADTAEQVTGIQSRHNEDIGLIGAGFKDPIDRQTLRTAFEAQPKATRGKDAGEWWQMQAAAHAAHLKDPKNVAAPSIPKPLTPYMPVPETKTETRQPEGGGDGWGRKGPPEGPGQRQPQSLDSVPTDQGMAALFAGLRGLGNG